MQEALDLNPDSTKAWYRQSQALSELGRAAEARTSAHAALQRCTASSTTAKQITELLQRLDLVRVRDNNPGAEPCSRQDAGKAGESIRGSQPGTAHSKGDEPERRICQGAGDDVESGELPRGSRPSQCAPEGTSLDRGTCQHSDHQPADALGAHIGPKGVSVKKTVEEGRHLVASRDLDAGATILAEDPFACVISKAHRNKVGQQLDPKISASSL